MRDRFGRQIMVGDEVAFIEPGYRNLMMGRILRITPKKVRVSYQKDGREYDHLTDGRDVIVKPDA